MDKRIKLHTEGLTRLFDGLVKAGFSLNDTAVVLGVHARTLRDWRRGKFTIPKHHFTKILELIGSDESQFTSEEISRWWYTHAGGLKGGRAYMEKHGQLGSYETRIAGGLASYRVRKDQEDGMFARKHVSTPPYSSRLAEFIGIMIGDGSVGTYQASVVLDIITDREYAAYVGQLVRELFGVGPTVQERPKSGCVVLVMSSVELTGLLVGLGLPRGHKLRNGLDIPAWVLSNKQYVTACLRGLFDTDGSVFRETHRRKDKTYSYPRLCLVSHSKPLRETVARQLIDFGIQAKIRGNRSVSIERFTDIEKYFKIVGSSNPKHLERWATFGGVG